MRLLDRRYEDDGGLVGGVVDDGIVGRLRHRYINKQI